MDESFNFVNEAGSWEAHNSAVVFHVKRQGNPQMLHPSQNLLILSQLKEFHRQTGFAAFLGLAVMTAAAEGVPHLARGASSLKTNHQLRRSCSLMQQVWRTAVRFFWMENSTCLLLVIFPSISPCTPIRKAFLLLLIGDRNYDRCSLWVKSRPAYSIAELLLTL